VFIASNTPDLNALLADLQNESDPNREFIAILLDADRGGIDQITAALSNLHNVAAVHLVSHGSEGRVELGNEILDVGTVSNHLNAIESSANALTSDADILIYGCDLAAAECGRALMQIIAEASGGDVAASDDATVLKLRAATGFSKNKLATSPQRSRSLKNSGPSGTISSQTTQALKAPM
jgi:hypothetical protein